MESPISFFLSCAGNYIGYRECHITPDWLLIYIIGNGRLVLTA
ncbi:MAG: type II toxin-antitoxin system YafQ family toxin [Fibromonadaceae bacterium]|nr:type II toxin-antitoxin system YafQ family toxin [Fibromonadaceae bacterium]